MGSVHRMVNAYSLYSGMTKEILTDKKCLSNYLIMEFCFLKYIFTRYAGFGLD